MKPPEMVKATRRLVKEEEKWTPIEINICRRLETIRAFFRPNLSEITPANIRPNIRAGWLRLTLIKHYKKSSIKSDFENFLPIQEI